MYFLFGGKSQSFQTFQLVGHKVLFPQSLSFFGILMFFTGQISKVKFDLCVCVCPFVIVSLVVAVVTFAVLKYALLLIVSLYFFFIFIFFQIFWRKLPVAIFSSRGILFLRDYYCTAYTLISSRALSVA